MHLSLLALCAPLAVARNVTRPTTEHAHELDLRLVSRNHRKHEGTLQIFHAGAWGTVCDDGWDMRNAEVACRQLGFGDADEARLDPFDYYTFDNYDYDTPFSFNRPQINALPIWMDNVRCSGSEKHLGDCAFRGWNHENCGHFEDVAIRCKDYDLERTVTFSITFFCVSTTLSVLSLTVAIVAMMRVVALQNGRAVFTSLTGAIELPTVMPQPVQEGAKPAPSESLSYASPGSAFSPSTPSRATDEAGPYSALL